MNDPLALRIQTLKTCPKCDERFDSASTVCTHDGSMLVKLESDPHVGTLLAGRYKILSLLGTGSWGSVYRAHHQQLDTLVAIKMLHAHMAESREKLGRFEQEAKAACGLRHHNVASVFDFGTAENGQPYFVMELLNGLSLDSVLDKDQRFSEKRAINIFKQICLGLGSAHKCGVVHRDVKPSNVVLIPEAGGAELVKIIDFGLAKITLDDGTSMAHLTQTGDTLGTPAYMSPEQCYGQKLDRRADIYSLGCLMYETLTGKPPFVGATIFETMSKHVDNIAEPFSKVSPEATISGALEEIVFKCLEKRPRDRYQSCEELSADLGALEPTTTRTTFTSMPVPAVKKRFLSWRRTLIRHKRSLLVIGLVVSGAGALLAYHYLQWHSADPAALPPDQRWAHYMTEGIRALDKGLLEPARRSFKQSEALAKSFVTPERLHITLANEAIIAHMKNNVEVENQLNNALAAVLVSNQGLRKKVHPTKVKPPDLDLLAAMLDKATNAQSVDKRELLSLAGKVNEVAAANQYVVARELEQKNAAMIKQYFGDNNQAYAMAMQYLSEADYLEDKYQGALDKMLVSYNIYKQSINLHSADWGVMLGDVGIIYLKLARYKEAIDYLERAVTVEVGKVPINSRLATMESLTDAYCAVGDYRQAYETVKRIVALVDSANEYMNADNATSRVATMAHLARADTECENYLLGRKQTIGQQDGPRSQGVASADESLAELYLIQRRYDKAEPLARESLEIRQVQQRPLRSVRTALETLARVYMAQHNYAAALPLYKVDLAIIQRSMIYDTDYGYALDALSKLAYLSLKTGDPHGATLFMRQFSQVLARLKPGDEDYDCTRAIDSVFTALQGFELSDADFDKLEACIKAQDSVHDRDCYMYNVPYPKVYDALSRIHELRGQLSQALEDAKQAVALSETNLPEYPWLAGRIYKHYAALLKEAGQLEAAQQMEKKASSYPYDEV